MNTAINTVKDLGQYAFWDTDVESMDLEKDKEVIVSRMFERAKLDDVLKTIVYYGVETCRNIVTANKYLSKQAMYLAHLLLSVPLEKFKAYAPSRDNF